MMEYTNHATNRKGSVKPKRRTGFTMMEMMITLAIMAILFGLAVPAVASIQKSLEMARLNSYAKDVYLAAQSRLTSMKATGELDQMLNELRQDDGLSSHRYLDMSSVEVDSDGAVTNYSSWVPQDWEAAWDSKDYVNLYGFMHDPNATEDSDIASNVFVSKYLISEASVSATTLDQHYYIEFNPYTGDVYAAFYSDAKTGFTDADIRSIKTLNTIGMGEPINEDGEGRKSATRKKFAADAGEIMLGYYRGDPTDMLSPNEDQPFRPVCEIINKEDLYVRVTCDLAAEPLAFFENDIGKAEVILTAADTFSGETAKITIPLHIKSMAAADDRSDYADAGHGYVPGSLADGTLTAYILLDSLDNGGTPNIETALNDSTSGFGKAGGDNAAKFLELFKNGCDLTAEANFEIQLGDTTILTEPGSNITTQHSRFAAADGDGGVSVSYLRHLLNLNGYGDVLLDKGVSEMDIVQQSVREETPRIDADGNEVTVDGNVVMDPRPADIYFKSSDEYLVDTDGNKDTVTYWTDPELMVPGSALVNPFATIEPIELYAPTTTTLLDSVTYDGNGYGLYDFNIKNTTAGDAGDNTGLFATATDTTFQNVTLVDAKVRNMETIGQDYVGGLVGYATDTVFTNCAVRMRDKNPDGVKYIEGNTRLQDRSVMATKANYVGGLVGFADGCTFEQSYAAIYVQGLDNVGGLVGSADDCYITACYTSEDTVGQSRVGGMVGNMSFTDIIGTASAPCYATGDVRGYRNLGGFVGATKRDTITYANSYGKVIFLTPHTTNDEESVHGFVGNINNGNPSEFISCKYLRMSGYNTFADIAGISEAEIKSSDYSALTLTDSDGNYTNSEDDSHPYIISDPIFPFPMLSTNNDTNGDGTVDTNDTQTVIPHYGDWPVESVIQTCLVYYEKYDDGTYGFDVRTSLKGDDDTANSWVCNTLAEGDFAAVEDGYAILSSDVLTNIVEINDRPGGGEKPGTKKTVATPVHSGKMTLKSGENKISQAVYIYPLPAELQGMTDRYENAMKASNATYYQKLVLSGFSGSTAVFENYVFYYNPVLARTAQNPTPAQVNDPFNTNLCPAAADKQTPAVSLIRSARQLNALGRITWFWDKSLVFNQECNVNFSIYNPSYMDLDLSGAGQASSNHYRNMPIGTCSSTYGGEKPFTGTYDGGGHRIYDYCQVADEGVTVSGLFGVIDGACVKNVVLMADYPDGQNDETAFIRSNQKNGNGDAIDIAPLVGRVKNGAYVSPATGGGEAGSTDRKLKEVKKSAFSSEDNKSTLDSSAGTFTFNGDQSLEGGSWRDSRGLLIPTSDEEYTIVTVKGNFANVESARLYYSVQDHSWDPVVTYLDASNAAISEAGDQVTFTLHEADFYANPDTGEKSWNSFNLQLTGGDLSDWTKEGTSISIIRYTTAAASAGGSSGGNGPSAYLQQGVTSVENCAVAGYVVEYTPSRSEKAAHVGGLVGSVTGQVKNCSAVNKRVSATANDNGGATMCVGGLAGEDKGVIATSYAGGMLTGYAVGSGDTRIAGLVGNMNDGVLCDCYNYCHYVGNASKPAKFYGVAGGSGTIEHSHFFIDAITKSGDAYLTVTSTDTDGNETCTLSDKLLDKGKSWTYTITVKDTDASGNDLETTHEETVSVPYGLTYPQMKKLFSGGEYALRGTVGVADFDHSWPYDQTLEGSYPFPAVVTVSGREYFESQDGLLDADGNPVSGWKDVHRFNHFGDWILPPGTIYTNDAFFDGLFWADFCVDPTYNTDYRYYWDAWLKEMKYQASIGNLKEGDYIEIIVEPEFQYDRPEAVGKFQCAIHTLLKDTNAQVWDDVNDAAYEAQGVHFTNGQVCQFLFDVADVGIMSENDPQLWFAVNYHSSGGLTDGSLWQSLNKDDPDYYPGNEDPFRINRLTVNIYRSNTTSSTTNTTTRSSKTSKTNSEEEEQRVELIPMKEWTFEEAGAQNILFSSKSASGEITDLCGAGAAEGEAQHSNRITLSGDSSVRMEIGDAWSKSEFRQALKTGEGFQVEATFTLDAQDAFDPGYLGLSAKENQKRPMALQPYLVQPHFDGSGNLVSEDKYYANDSVIAQAVQLEGNNKGKIVWSQPRIFTFGEAGKSFDEHAYIVWTAPVAGMTLDGTLYVDNVRVKKVAQATGDTTQPGGNVSNPDVSDPKLQAVFRTDHVGDVTSPQYETSGKNQYRNASLGGTCKDIDTGITWTEFLKQHESLTETQYMTIEMTYPEGFAHAELKNFTFTCDSYSYGDSMVLSEIKAKSIDTENHKVTYEIYGPLDRSQLAEYGSMNMRTYFTYRNDDDLTNNTVLRDGLNDQFFVDVRIYDRATDATEMTAPPSYVPTEKRTTANLSGGVAVHTWASDTLGNSKYMTVKFDDSGYADGDKSNVMTWQEFATSVGALNDRQYMRITLVNNDNPFTGVDAASLKVNLNTYCGVDGHVIRGEVAKSANTSTIVYQINGPMSLNAVETNGGKEGYKDAGFTFTIANNSGAIEVGLNTSILVEIMSTETAATLQADSFDVANGVAVSGKTATITVSGDTFAPSITTNTDVTDWFTGLGGRNLVATVASVSADGTVLTINIASGTGGPQAPENDVTVTATIPGNAFTKGGSDVTATGSFVIGKVEPKASITGDDVRNFYLNEPNQSTVVTVQVQNATFTNNLDGTWVTGLPAGLGVTQMARVNDTTVAITISGTPTVESKGAVTFKVPAGANNSATELNAGTVTFEVAERPQVKEPDFSLAGGTYKGARTVSLSSQTEQAQIYYRLDETASWELYTGPITLPEGETTTVYAYATKTEYVDSDVVSATYIIEEDTNLLKNGYFDDGLDGWTINPSGTNAQVVDGKLVITDYEYSSDLNITASLKDGVTIKPNTTYRVSFEMTAGAGMTVKVNPGGNSSNKYEASGSYEFVTGPEGELNKFFVAISAPKNQAPVSGTFDNFELVEVGGGSDPTTPTETSQTETSQSQTETTKATTPTPTETTPSGERTQVAQWVTKHGISYGYFYGDTANANIYYNCAGNTTFGSVDGGELQWQAFVAKLVSDGLITSDAYLEIVYEGDASTIFQGAQATNATLSNQSFNISNLKAKYADDVKLVFQTGKGLVYNAAAASPDLNATISGITSGWASGAGTVTVTLYTGSTGGDPTEPTPSESKTSQSVTETTQSTPPTPVSNNLIVNGDFANGLNGWTQKPEASGEYAGFFTASGGKLNVDIPTYRSVQLIASYTEPLKGSTEYTLGVDMTTAGSANDKIVVTVKKDNNNSYKLTSTGSVTFTTPADATGVQVYISVAGNSDGLETAVIDNVILVEGDHIPTGGDPTEPTPTEPTTYTVSVTGGSIVGDTAVFAVGDTVTLIPPTTAPEGQEFVGWTVTAGGITVGADNTFKMPAANVTIEARYDYINYTISVSNGSAKVNGVAASTAHAGDTVTVTANAAETGKVFARWTGAGVTFANATSNSTTFTMPAANVSVEATYDWTMHNIIVKSSNDAWGSAQVVGGATTGHYTEEITLTATPATGYEFTGWSVKNSLVTVGADNKFLMANTEVEITANFAKIVVPEHTITVTNGTFTTASIQTPVAKADVPEGTTVYLTANEPAAGKVFSGWTVNSNNVTLVNGDKVNASFDLPTTLSSGETVEITANYTDALYTVNCNAVQNGTISANPTSNVKYDDAVALTATPAEGYELQGWTVTKVSGGAVTVSGNSFTMPADSVNVSATFSKVNYTITKDTSNESEGSVTVQTSAQFGDTVTMTATANPGWTFDSWTVTKAGGGTVSVSGNSFTMPASNVRVKANFTVDTNAPIASWTTTGGVNYTHRDGATGVANVHVEYSTVGSEGKTFAKFMENMSLTSGQYMKVTVTKSADKFGNARRAATTLTMNGLTFTTHTANDSTMVFYLIGAQSVAGSSTLDINYSNASAVPANTAVTVTVEVYNYTTSPIAGLDVTDATATYTVAVDGGTASPASAKPGTDITVTPATQSGKTFVGWELDGDGTNYLYKVDADQDNKDNPLTFKMPYNNVSIKAKFETAATDPTQPTPVTGNMLVNGDFKLVPVNADQWGFKFNDEGLGWKNGGIAQEGGASTFTSGSYTVQNGNDSTKALYQEITFTAGKSYTLTVNVNVATGPLDIRLYNGKTMVQSVGTIAAGTSGTQTFTFTPSETAGSIYFGGGGAKYTITSAVLTESGSTPVTDPVVTDPIVTDPIVTEPSQSTPVGGTATVTANVSYKTGQWSDYTTVTDTMTYNIGQTATVNVTFSGWYRPYNIKDADWANFVTGMTVNGATLTPTVNYPDGETVDVTLSYTFTVTGDTVINATSTDPDFHVPTVSLSGGTSGGDTPTQATTTTQATPSGNLLSSYSWETVSGGMTTSGNAMEIVSNGKSSADFRIKNIALDAGTYTLTASVTNGFNKDLKFKIGGQSATVSAGATQDVSVTLNIDAATSVDLQMIASSYPEGVATVSGVALTKS